MALAADEVLVHDRFREAAEAGYDLHSMTRDRWIFPRRVWLPVARLDPLVAMQAESADAAPATRPRRTSSPRSGG